MKRFFLFSLIFIMVFMSLSVSGSALPEGPIIVASSALLIDAERGQVLCQLNADNRLSIPCASKIMTVLVALEKGNLDSTVTISKEAINTEIPVLPLNAGEKLILSDILYAVLMTSSNDAANAVAEHVGGNVEKFVELMNASAAKLGMNNTHFTNPTGLYVEQQYTTASDMAILMKYAVANEQFNDIFSSNGKPWVSETVSRVLINHNNMFWQYEGINGGQLSYSEDGNVSAITSATRNNMRLICIALQSSEQDIYNDTRLLLDYGFTNYMRGTLVTKGTVLKDITYSSKEYNLAPIEDEYYVFPIGEDYIQNVSVNIANNLKLPVTTLQIAGTATYTLLDGTSINVYLYPDKDIITAVNFIAYVKYRLSTNIEIVVALIILAAIEIIMITGKFAGSAKKTKPQKSSEDTQ